ncbi:MAG: EamA family transporter [Nitriliruptoraceae bacterium]|nr:EamA family transporter [Nitriliruptoraceae bacterium]
MAAVLALISSILFGGSDVAGAVATRRAGAVPVSLGILLAGAVPLVPALLLLDGEVSLAALGLGAAAGIAGSASLLVYLKALAMAPVGVISPIAALVGVTVPVAWGTLVLGEAVSPGQRLGIALGACAVVAVAYVPGTPLRSLGARGPGIAVLAGAGFGTFVILLDATPAVSGLWPIAGARVGGTITVIIAGIALGRRLIVPRVALAATVVSGVLDVAANITLLLATRAGLLTLVALLSSLYPVVALLLARALLAERLHRSQVAGVALAMAAIALLVTS